MMTRFPHPPVVHPEKVTTPVVAARTVSPQLLAKSMPKWSCGFTLGRYPKTLVIR